MDMDLLAARILNQRDTVHIEQKNLGDLLRRCTHRIVNDRDSAHCNVCGINFGWWCPDSDNHQCDYFHQAEGEAEGIGTWDYDECIHCGGPEERK